MSESKIFGIGLAKTGTTSLHFALEALGLRSVHSSSFLSDAMNAEDSAGDLLFSSLEATFDAFLDWPVSRLYPLLDLRFPGSKFILTVRHPVARFRSALRHTEHDRSRRSAGFSHAWTTLVSPEEFVANDARHNSIARAYFAQRPEDFLEMNTHDFRWEQLCNFLSRPIPLGEFPHHRPAGSHDCQFVREHKVESRQVEVRLIRWLAEMEKEFLWRSEGQLVLR